MERIIDEIEQRKVEVDLETADIYEIVEIVLPECLDLLKVRGVEVDEVLVSGFCVTRDNRRDDAFRELYLTDMALLADASDPHNPFIFAVEESDKKDRKFINLYDKSKLVNLGELEPEQNFFTFKDKDLARSCVVAQVEIVQSR